MTTLETHWDGRIFTENEWELALRRGAHILGVAAFLASSLQAIMKLVRRSVCPAPLASLGEALQRALEGYADASEVEIGRLYRGVVVGGRECPRPGVGAGAGSVAFLRST